MHDQIVPLPSIALYLLCSWHIGVYVCFLVKLLLLCFTQIGGRVPNPLHTLPQPLGFSTVSLSHTWVPTTANSGSGLYLSSMGSLLLLFTCLFLSYTACLLLMILSLSSVLFENGLQVGTPADNRWAQWKPPQDEGVGFKSPKQ